MFEQKFIRPKGQPWAPFPRPVSTRTDPIWAGVALGLVNGEDCAMALSVARRYGGRPLDVLVAKGKLTAHGHAVITADHHQIARIDLGARVPSPTLAYDYDPKDCLRLGFVPWQRLGQTRLIAVADPANMAEISALPGHGHDARIRFVVAPRTQIEQVVIDLYWGDMADRAELLCPDHMSCRNWSASRFARQSAIGLASLLALILIAPTFALGALVAWIILANALTMGVRLISLAILPRARRQERISNLGHQLPRHLPTVTILLPVLRETRVLSSLINAMRALDYPEHKLDLILLVEQNDTAMLDALVTHRLPHNMRMLVIPDATLRTKPRAMNYALPFCRGEIIGIFDAEDRPHPDQIRKIAAHLNSVPETVACVQAQLDFYNPTQNWLTRCFTLEYATWFRVLLHGTQALKFPLPLGGTSVYFRAHLLREFGGWDAHNVTEDADLGMRLARAGFRCEMVRSTTYEEANPVITNWLGQRSRWLKGYAITWATHMRNPVTLWQDLGPAGFLGFQILFMGALTAYLAIPFLWMMVAAKLLGWSLSITMPLPGFMLSTLGVTLVLGQAVMLLTVAQALRSRGDWKLMPWVLTLPFYWPLGAVAAWRATVELAFAPFHWHKTDHGFDPDAPQ